jgi:hypothetical protein
VADCGQDALVHHCFLFIYFRFEIRCLGLSAKLGSGLATHEGSLLERSRAGRTEITSILGALDFLKWQVNGNVTSGCKQYGEIPIPAHKEPE